MFFSRIKEKNTNKVWNLFFKEKHAEIFSKSRDSAVKNMCINGNRIYIFFQKTDKQ